MNLRLEDDQMCFVCGPQNTAGFRLVFEHPRPGLLRSQVTFKKEHQGFKDIVHGGLVAALLDEMMVNLAWKEGFGAVTAELNVRLKRPVPVGEAVLLEGALEEVGQKLMRYSASLKDANGRLLASATAKCLRIPGGLAKPGFKE